MRRTSAAAAGIGIALALSLGLASGGCTGDKDAAAEAQSALQPVVLGPENITVAESRELVDGPTISGSLAPEREAEVRAEVAGAVLEVRAEPGQRVKRGDVLARIDATALRDAALSARAAARSAVANVQVTRRNAERTEALAEAGAIADRELEQAQWNVTSAEAASADAKARLVSANEQLDDATVRAPFAGIVSRRDASAGDIVQPGAALFTIVDPASMRLEASVPADALSGLAIGTPVTFTVNGYEGRTFAGKIERINPAADPATGQVRIYVTIPNAGGSLVAGLFAEGRVRTESRQGIALPFNAVDERGVTPSVLKIRGARVERTPVELGVRDAVAEAVEIVSGVAAGDTVILGSAQGLSAGTAVTVGSAD